MGIQERLAVACQHDDGDRFSINGDGLRHHESLLPQVTKTAVPRVARRAHGLEIVAADDSEGPDGE
jgi:hypothetical protein